MRSKWNHPICDECWKDKCELEGESGRTPYRVKGPFLSREKCCFCHKPTESGIYVRGKPEETPCGGEHSESDPPQGNHTGKSAIEEVPKIFSDIVKFGKEVGKALTSATLKTRDEILEKTSNHNIANNATLYGVVSSLSAAISNIIRDSKKEKVDVEKLFPEIECAITDAVSNVMSKYMGEGSSIVTLDVERDPKKRPRVE